MPTVECNKGLICSRLPAALLWTPRTTCKPPAPGQLHPMRLPPYLMSPTRKNAAMSRTVVTALLVLAVVGCTSTAKLYNLETGEVIQATFEDFRTGHGRINARLPDGQIMEGEYSMISDTSLMKFVSGKRSAGTDRYAWAAAQGFSFNRPGKRYGSATLFGGGRVIDLVYAVSPVTSRGSGVGRDNEGIQYKIDF